MRNMGDVDDLPEDGGRGTGNGSSIRGGSLNRVASRLAMMMDGSGSATGDTFRLRDMSTRSRHHSASLLSTQPVRSDAAHLRSSRRRARYAIA